MPRKLKITLWVAIGLLASLPAVVMVEYWAGMPAATMERLADGYNPFILTVKGTVVPVFLIMFGLIFACGIAIVYWTKKHITQVALRRYLLLAGASAMGMLFFGVPVHMFTEAGDPLSLGVCPIALVVGVVKALRFKSAPAG